MAGDERLSGRGILRKLTGGLLAASALAALSTTPGVAASPGAGQLDPAFGKHGLLTMSGQPTGGYGAGQAQFARAPGGRLVVLLPEGEAASVLRYLPEGRPDPGFGDGGRVQLQEPVQPPVEFGYSRFDPAAVAVDKTGRIVIASNLVGTSCVPRCGMVVQRLQEDGAPDRSFGSGGTAVPDFGFAPVAIPPMTLLGGNPGPESGPATTNTNAIQIDGSGRIVVAGRVVTSYYFSPKIGQYLPRYSPLIARLLPGGRVDAGFGSLGATVLTELEDGKATALALDSSQRSVISVCAPAGTGFVRLSAEGLRQSRFGAEGIAVAAGCPQAIAIDRADRLLALVARGTCGYGAETICGTVLVRRRTDGTPDRRFGTRGQVRPEARFGTVLAWQDLALDGRGRIDVAGVLAARADFPNGFLFPVALEAIRFSSEGVIDRGFGHRGRIAIRPPHMARFSTHTRARLLLSSGRLLVGLSYPSVEFGDETTMVAGFRGG